MSHQKPASPIPMLLFTLVFVLSLAGLPQGFSTIKARAQASPEASTVAKHKHILVLRSYGYGREGPERYNRRFFETLIAGGMGTENIIVEYLDLDRNQGREFRTQKRKLLLHQYRQRQIDLIVAVEQPALNFLLEELRELLPGIPVMAITAMVPRSALTADSRFVQKALHLDFKGTLERGLEIFPETKRVIVVTGTGEQDLTAKEHSQRLASHWQGRIEFEYTDQLSFDEILKRIANLPPNTLVVFRTFNKDKTGEVFVPYEAVVRIAKAANAPVFGLFDNYVGTGVVGGSVYHIQREAERAAAELLAILNGKMVLTKPLTELSSQGVPMFDWQQIERWGGSTKRLPPESIFINRPLTLWGQYRWFVMGSVCTILILSSLTLALIIQRGRKRWVERNLREKEEVLRKSNQLFSLFMHHSPIYTYIKEVTPSRSVVLQASDNYRLMIGIPGSEMAGKTMEELFPPEFAAKITADDWSVVSRGGVLRLDEELNGRSYTTIKFPILQGDKTLLAGYTIDITERKQAEEALHKSEARFRAIFSQAAVGVAEIEMNTGRFITINRSLSEMVGRSEEEMRETTFQAITHPDDLHIHEEKSALLAAGKIRYYELEKRYIRKDGATIWVNLTSSPLWEPGEPPTHNLIVVQNITERKRAEEALRQNEMRLKNLFMESPIPTFTWQKRGDDFILIDCNHAAIEITGGNAPALLGESAAKLYGERPQILDDMRLCFQERSTVKREVTSRHFAPGRDLLVYYGFVPPDLIIVHTDDQTERKKAEAEKTKLQEQLLQSQRIEAIGQLAGGIAHDFNNMLGVILGHTEMLLDRMDPSDPLNAHLAEVRKAALRSSGLTGQLLAFARKQTISPKVLDLNDTIDGILKMLRRLIGEDIHLNWLPDPALWLLKIDPSQIDQILANLCVNARDAIAGVGKITVETGNIRFDGGYCMDHPGFVPGEYVLLAVSDNGCGMDKETLGKLFEPFFTTKEVGKGTGLGLATVYGIVRQNSGFINVYSEPGHGTTFKIYLPRHIGKAEEAQTEGSQTPVMRGHETILLVEDEPALLELNKLILERQGYRVLAAGTPGEAIRLAGGHAGEIDLLMTDVVMPEMNGRELARKMASLSPRIKCLFTSGYTANVIAHHGVLDEGVHFIQKPCSRKALAAKVREVLDRKAGLA